MLAKGTKVESPHVRATSKNGTIHAVDRPADAEAVIQAKTLCGKTALPADKPLRRFQQGLGKECAACTGKVINARLEAIRVRKASRSKKNQPQMETVVEKPVKSVTNAKPATAKPATAKAAKAAPKKVAAAAAPKKVSATAVKKTAKAG